MNIILYFISNIHIQNMGQLIFRQVQAKNVLNGVLYHRSGQQNIKSFYQF